MSEMYPLLSLKDAGVELIDCVHATPKETGSLGYPYVGIPQIEDGRLNLSDAKMISPHRSNIVTFTISSRPEISKNSFLLSPLGLNALGT